MAIVSLSACDATSSSDPSIAASTEPPTTASDTYEDGQPGSCLILEEKHCLGGKLVRWGNGNLLVGFTLPPGTPLFAFGGGQAVEMYQSPDTNATGDASTSYPGVHIALAAPEADVVDVVALFMNRDGDPDVHLVTVDAGEWIGELTSDPLPLMPLGTQDGDYNLLVWLGDFETPSVRAYQEYFGLAVEP